MLRRQLERLYERLFGHIDVDSRWIEAVRDASSRGQVVYVLRSSSLIDLFALDYVTSRYDLPRVGFANQVAPWIFEARSGLARAFLRTQTWHGTPSDLRDALRSGKGAILFLKRPGSILEGAERGKLDSEPFIDELLSLDAQIQRPILLVPQVFVWTRHPDSAEISAVDWLLGPREWPGYLRAISQYIASYGNVVMRSGEPLDVRAFVAAEGKNNDGTRVDREQLITRLSAILLQRIERERKSITGPTRKTADQFHEDILRSPKLQSLIQELAGEGRRERMVLTAKALTMLREMEASVDMNAIAAMGRAFETITSHMYEAMEVDHEGLERLREISKTGTLVLLPSHKSHLDYMVIAYVCLRHNFPIPVAAAGENLNFFPIGPIFRRAGAFFIRRKFTGDRLYVAVVDAYMQRLLQDGFSIEFYLEGGRSRTGKLLAPKFGLLSMVVDAALSSSRKVYFCPISIGYERFVEEKSFVRELTGGEKRKEDVRGVMSTFALMMGRYGRLNIQFGEPLTLDQIAGELDHQIKDTISAEEKRSVVTRLGFRVMNEINHVTAVTPGALVACALLAHQARGIAHEQFVALCTHLADVLRTRGARFVPSLASSTDPSGLRPAALREALELFLRAGHVEAHRPGSPEGSAERRVLSDDSIYIVRPDARLVLDLSKNIVLHFFVARALIATSVLAASTFPVSEDALRDRVRNLSRLFKFEFSFRVGVPFDNIFDDELSQMVQDGVIEHKAAGVAPAGPAALKRVLLYANLVRNFIEGYRIAARNLSTMLRSSQTSKEFLKRSMALGERMFLAGEITCRESVSKPLFESALQVFVDQGYVEREHDGKLQLTATYATAETCRTIEAKVVGFLPRDHSSVH